MDHLEKTTRPLKLAFGTCIIFVRTPDEIYVAADTRRTTIDIDDEAECLEPACKVVKLGTSVLEKNVYAAVAGLSSHEGIFDAFETCKRVFDPSKSIGENLESIEGDVCGKYSSSTSL